MSFSEREKRHAVTMSRRPARRERSSRPAGVRVYHKPVQKQDEERSFKEAFIHVFLKDNTTFWQGVLILVCIYAYLQTKEAAWLFTASALLSGSSSLQNVKTLHPLHKASSHKEDDVP